MRVKILRAPARQHIPPCYHGTASLKMCLHWLIAWLQPHDQNWKFKACFDAINRQAFWFDWSRKGVFTWVNLSRTTLCFDAINWWAFWFNWSRNSLLLFNSIVAARLNHLCKHPHSQLFQFPCRLFAYLVVNCRNE
jgi:hypothetical protein